MNWPNLRWIQVPLLALGSLVLAFQELWGPATWVLLVAVWVDLKSVHSRSPKEPAKED